MKKKNIFLFVALVVIAIVGLVLFYRFAQWYSQALGSIFSYIIMVSFIMLIFAPFKLMKDKKAKINLVSYIKYLGCTLLSIGKMILSILKESILTISYMVSKLFSKGSNHKTSDE
jgi:tellurite resistance protein TehA-like permease